MNAVGVLLGKSSQLIHERALPATSQIEACWRDEDESRVQLATTTQQMIEAHEVLAICGDERPTQTRHAGEENDIYHASELFHLDDRERVDTALDEARRDRRAQVLVEGQLHAGSASPRSATHA